MTDIETEILETIHAIKEKLKIDEKEASMIAQKAFIGGEMTENNFKDWYNNRFITSLVFIDEEGYSKMCVDALKIMSTTAATDYGSSRQRDMGQLWADMTRGYLGELAFLQFLKKRWNIDADLGHETGTLEEYLPMDIHKIKKPNEEQRSPNIKISIKTTKWNGIWLDIPGDQFAHSDVHILVKVGAGRDHLFAFFKIISVFKDKVLKVGEKVGSLTPEEAEALFNSLPSFRPVPAYICGFVLKNGHYEELSYKGTKGRLNYKVNVWNGPIRSGDLNKIKEYNEVPGKIEFEGIGKFAHENGYLFNAGSLLWKKNEWESVIKNI